MEQKGQDCKPRLAFAAVFGPLLVARIREATGSYSGALTILAWGMLGSSLLPLLVGGHRAVKAPTCELSRIENVPKGQQDSAQGFKPTGRVA